MARRSRSEEFHTWSGRAREIVGQDIPRTVDMSTLPSEVLEEGNARAERFGRELPALAAADLASVENRIKNPNASRNPAYTKNLEAELRSARRAVESTKDLGPIDTSIGSMTSNVQRLINNSIEIAKKATRFNEQSGSSNLELPAGFDFYPQHAGAYSSISHDKFGDNPEMHRRLIMAGTPLSAGTTPKTELRGASALASLVSKGDEYGFTIDDKAANYLNAAAAKVRSGGHEFAPITAGSYSLTDKRVSPEHASVVLRHHKKMMSGKTGHEALSGLKFSQGASNLSSAADALIGAAGKNGVKLVASGLRTMQDPRQFSEAPSTPGQWKVPSYGTTTLLHHSEHADLTKALEHMVGAAIHGEKYWEANKGAQEHVEKYMNHPALTNPHIVSDIHNARALMGLDYQTSVNLGDRVRPETMLTRPRDFPKDDIPSARGRTGVQVQDLGYLVQEHATRQASMKYSMGGKKYELPHHAKQALIWYAQQSGSKSNRAKLASGDLSMLHSVVSRDPTKSLNPIVKPDL